MMMVMAMVIISSYNIIFDFHKNLHQDQLLDCKLGRGRQLNEKEQIKLQVGDCQDRWMIVMGLIMNMKPKVTLVRIATMMSKC